MVFIFVRITGYPGALGTASRSTLLASLSCWRFGCWIASWPQINSILVHPCSSGCRPCSADNWMTLMASRHMKKLNTNLFFYVRKLRKYTPARKSCKIDSATIHDSRCAREQIWKIILLDATFILLFQHSDGLWWIRCLRTATSVC